MEQCYFCETKFEVVFDDNSIVTTYCPACGEKYDGVVEDTPWEFDNDPDGGFWDDV